MSCRATAEWYWQGKIEELGEKPVLVPLWSPQIPHGLTRAQNWAFAVRNRQLTAWAMARPNPTITKRNKKLQWRVNISLKVRDTAGFSCPTVYVRICLCTLWIFLIWQRTCLACQTLNGSGLNLRRMLLCQCVPHSIVNAKIVGTTASQPILTTQNIPTRTTCKPLGQRAAQQQLTHDGRKNNANKLL
jgi:hypothetical protein